MKNPKKHQTAFSLAQAEEGVQTLFGCSPDVVLLTMTQAVKVLNWLSVLFQVIEGTDPNDCIQGAHTVRALSALGAYLADDFEVNVIGAPVYEMRDHLADTRLKLKGFPTTAEEIAHALRDYPDDIECGAETEGGDI
jgi:hypothetical protein